MPASAWQFYRERYDADGDGCIARAEYTRSQEGFTNLDANRDGIVSFHDFAKRWSAEPRPGGAAGGFFVEPEPGVGEPAPEFELLATTGERYRLSEFRGKKPVVLVFGSFTWGPFWESAGRLAEVVERWGETVQFLAVYIREAHALDSVLAERHDGRWLGGSPERDLFIEDPITFAERRTLAQRCEREMQLGCPMLVDALDDSVNLGYAAWPERLYLVDVDGTLIYRGDRGPDGFMPDELETELERCSEAWSTGATAGSAPRLAETQPDESALGPLLER